MARAPTTVLKTPFNKTYKHLKKWYNSVYARSLENCQTDTLWLQYLMTIGSVSSPRGQKNSSRQRTAFITSLATAISQRREAIVKRFCGGCWGECCLTASGYQRGLSIDGINRPLVRLGFYQFTQRLAAVCHWYVHLFSYPSRFLKLLPVLLKCSKRSGGLRTPNPLK